MLCHRDKGSKVKGGLLMFFPLGQGKETAGFTVGTTWKGGKKKYDVWCRRNMQAGKVKKKLNDGFRRRCYQGLRRNRGLNLKHAGEMNRTLNGNSSNGKPKPCNKTGCMAKLK